MLGSVSCTESFEDFNTNPKAPTPEQMEKVNQMNREKECRRKLRQHFDVGDIFETLP